MGRNKAQQLRTALFPFLPELISIPSPRLIPATLGLARGRVPLARPAFSCISMSGGEEHRIPGAAGVEVHCLGNS